MVEKTTWMQVKAPEFPWQRLKRLEESGKAQQTEIINLKQQVQVLTEQNRSLANENYSFQNNVNALTKRQDQLVATNQDLSAQVALLQNENIALRKQLNTPTDIENNKRIDYYEVVYLYNVAAGYDKQLKDMQDGIVRNKVDLNAPVTVKMADVIDISAQFLVRGSKDFNKAATRFEGDFSKKYAGDTTTAYRNTHHV